MITQISGELWFDWLAGFPALIRCAHQDFDFHITVYSDLAGQAELPKDPIFFEALALWFAHRGLFAEELDAAGCTFGEPATAMADILAGLLQGQHKFGALGYLDRVPSVNANYMA